MSDPTDLDVIDLSDPWTQWGLAMAKLWKAAGNPPDETLLASVEVLTKLRLEVEAGRSSQQAVRPN